MKLLFITLGIIIAIIGAFIIIPSNNTSYISSVYNSTTTQNFSTSTKNLDEAQTLEEKEEEEEEEEKTIVEIPNIEITHIKTPNIVGGVYITQQTFSNTNKMNEIISFASSTDMNSAVIDISSDGDPLFTTNYQIAVARLSYMHSKGIYLIARIVTLNDQKSGWYDPLSKERRQTLYDISKRAVDAGFDEINYDYVRYPGPGEPDVNIPMEDRIKNITSLFQFLKESIRDKINRPISLDIFGSTFIYPETRIGQSMENAIKYFDYIIPMPYPSHWADNTFGYKKPGQHPYEMVFNGLNIGWKKVINDPERISELRSWIQDFNLESISPIKYLDYTPEMIHQQIYACEDAGCTGWILWNPRNQYRESSLIIPKIKKPTSTTTSSSTPISTTTSSSSSQ